MKYQVYQSYRKGHFLVTRARTIAKYTENFPIGFLHVADVKANSLGECFELTNTIDRLWTENEQCTVHIDPKYARSTSSGDVVIDEQGKKWFCDTIGWVEFE